MLRRSWTDDLPKCQSTGVAYFHPVNEVQSEELSESNFRYFYCHLDDTCLYGVFDAHNGIDVAHFVLPRMAAEILLGQLSDKSSDEEIKEVLRNSFLSVEKAYIVSIDVLVAKRTSLQYELPDGLSPEKLSQQYHDVLKKLQNIDEKLSGGATSVIALIHSGKLYVANVGNSRALLCKADDNNVLRVVQLSIDHSLDNEDELLRLSQLKLDTNKLRNADTLGNQSNTRCLGNYLVKGFYRAFPDMSTATSEPVIAIPEVHGPILLDDSCRFLVLVSDGLYKNLQESTDTEQVNKRFAQMIVEQFRAQASLKAVCQAVVDQTMNIYHEYCSQTSKVPRRNNRNTLLIRNFNFLLPNAPIHRSPLLQRQNFKQIPDKKSNVKTTMNEPNQSSLTVPNDKCHAKENSSPDSSKPANTNTVRFDPVVQTHSHNNLNDASDVESYTNGSSDAPNVFLSPEQTRKDSNQSGESYISTITSQFPQGTEYSGNSSNTDTSSELYPNNSGVPYDRNRKIESYVDFSQYYENIEKARQNGTLPQNFNFD